MNCVPDILQIKNNPNIYLETPNLNKKRGLSPILIIYFLEAHPLYTSQFLPLFEQIDSGRLQAVVSPVTVAEVVAGPLYHGNELLAERYYQALTSGNNWLVQDLTAEISFLAARMRVRYQLKLPDAIQIAIAVNTGSAALITHDRDFRNVEEMLILGL